MVFWAAVTVDPLHIGQTSTLSGLLDAAATNSVVSVASARFAAIETKVPEAGDTVFTFLSPDTILAHTLASCLWKSKKVSIRYIRTDFRMHYFE